VVDSGEDIPRTKKTLNERFTQWKVYECWFAKFSHFNLWRGCPISFHIEYYPEFLAFISTFFPQVFDLRRHFCWTIITFLTFPCNIAPHYVKELNQENLYVGAVEM
jgi:hypothetical protein